VLLLNIPHSLEVNKIKLSIGFLCVNEKEFVDFQIIIIIIIIILVLEKRVKHVENTCLFFSYLFSIKLNEIFINFCVLITNYFNIRFPLPSILLLQRSRFKEVRVKHFEIPSPKYIASLLPILLLLRSRLIEMRVIHFEIHSPKYGAPLSPILLWLRFRCKEVRVTHLEILSPKYFSPFSLILLWLRFRNKEVRVAHFEISSNISESFFI